MALLWTALSDLGDWTVACLQEPQGLDNAPASDLLGHVVHFSSDHRAALVVHRCSANEITHVSEGDGVVAMVFLDYIILSLYFPDISKIEKPSIWISSIGLT